MRIIDFKYANTAVFGLIFIPESSHAEIDFLLDSSLAYDAPSQVAVSYALASDYSAAVKTRFDSYGFLSLTERDVSWPSPLSLLHNSLDRVQSLFSPSTLKRIDRGDVSSQGSRSPHGSDAVLRQDILDEAFGQKNWLTVTTLREYHGASSRTQPDCSSCS